MSSVNDQINTLLEQVRSADLPGELSEKLLYRLEQLSGLVESPTFLPEYDRMNKYVEWALSLPWKKRTKDILDLAYAKEILDKSHFGLEGIKNRVLEYISVMNLKQSEVISMENSPSDQGQNQEGGKGEIYRAPILCFVGLVGTGKTTIAHSIAQAMGRKFARIPFGGMGSPLELRGQSRMHYESEPGKIIKALRYTQSKNPVILLDEIDRVTDAGRASIMGVLVELLDPEQNQSFIDHYIDYPFDLSEVLFIATANNTHHISTAVLDRLEPIQMPSYSDQEKIAIARDYMLPSIVEQSGIPPDSFEIIDETWPLLVRPLGYDAGMRTLERTIQAIVRKVARRIVEGKGDKFKITPENMREYK